MALPLALAFLNLQSTTLLLCLLLAPLLTLLLFQFTTRKSTSPNRKLPPTPPSSLPVLGHLHHLSHLPHRSLQKLSSRYGPVILLHLGRVPTVVISSASAVQEAIHLHDLALSNRPHFVSVDILAYGSTSVPFAPYGDHWHQARRIYSTHMLSVKQVQSFRRVREEEAALLVERMLDEVSAAGEKVVNLSKLLIHLTKDIVCR